MRVGDIQEIIVKTVYCVNVLAADEVCCDRDGMRFTRKNSRGSGRDITKNLWPVPSVSWWPVLPSWCVEYLLYHLD